MPSFENILKDILLRSFSRQLRKTIKDLLSIKDKWILLIGLGKIFLLNDRWNTRVKAGIQD